MRETAHTPYTYLLRFKPTGQLYYGVRFAKKCHPDELWVSYFSSSKVIKQLIEDYGSDAFEYEVRSTFVDAGRARKLEERVHRWFDVKRASLWLNQHNAGSLCFTRSHTPQTRAKMSESAKRAARHRGHDQYRKTGDKLRGRKQTPEHIAAHAAARRGTKQSLETIAKRVAQNTGRVFTEDQKARMAEGQRGMKMFANIETFQIKRFFESPGEPWHEWNNKWGMPKQMREQYPRELFTDKPAPSLGKKPRPKKPREEWNRGKFERSPEWKEHISKVLSGRGQSDEHIKNNANARLGHKQKPETIFARAQANRGKKRTAEQIDKLRQGQNRYANLESLTVKRFPLGENPAEPWVKWNSAHGVPKEYREQYPKNRFTIM